MAAKMIDGFEVTYRKVAPEDGYYVPGAVTRYNVEVAGLGVVGQVVQWHRQWWRETRTGVRYGRGMTSRNWRAIRGGEIVSDYSVSRDYAARNLLPKRRDRIEAKA